MAGVEVTTHAPLCTRTSTPHREESGPGASKVQTTITCPAVSAVFSHAWRLLGLGASWRKFYVSRWLVGLFWLVFAVVSAVIFIVAPVHATQTTAPLPEKAPPSSALPPGQIALLCWQNGTLILNEPHLTSLTYTADGFTATRSDGLNLSLFSLHPMDHSGTVCARVERGN